MRFFAGQICSRCLVNGCAGENSATTAPKREMAQWRKLGCCYLEISGCAIRGTKRPQDGLVPSHRTTDYNAGILVAVQNYKVWSASGKFPERINIDQVSRGVEPMLLISQKREELMFSRPFPEIPCAACRKPIDLQTDLCADENGNAAHADCYIKRITSARLVQARFNSHYLC